MTATFVFITLRESNLANKIDAAVFGMYSKTAM